MGCEWTLETKPYPGGVGPPPWPSLGDPRTPDCKHDWDYEWGQKGEVQRRCRHCERWIWERAWWPETSAPSGTEDAA